MDRLVVIVFMVLITPFTANAGSTVTDVTPANVTNQPLALRVAHEKYEDGTVRFEIYVSAGTEEISPSHDGRFVVWQEKVTVRSGFIHDSSTRPLAVAECSVHERARGDTLFYEVQVNRELLDRVTFTFLNFEQRMPAFDGYEIMLGQFAEERK